MSVFSKILDKLGLGKGQPTALDKLGLGKHEHTATTSAPVAAPPKPAAPAPAAKPATPTTTTAKPAASAPTSGTGARPANVMEKDEPAMAPAPKAMSQVDVMSMLEQKARGTGLNWKQSIVDLLTLLDIDHSREARNELAKELGCPPEFMSDSAKMNTWLHKTVLRKIAENGGNIPQELLD
jgi:Domain of unknown function (DUF3597)